ncbi:MAG: hypothetical protein K1W14_06670 [Muribaculaceae bacterium]
MEFEEYDKIKAAFDAIVALTEGDNKNEIVRMVGSLAEHCGEGETMIPFVAILMNSSLNEEIKVDILNGIRLAWDEETFYNNIFLAGSIRK